jgi:hypothetical protein
MYVSYYNMTNTNEKNLIQNILGIWCIMYRG